MAPSGSEETTLNSVLDSLPVGFFHYRLLFMGGIGFMADAMEVSLLSYLSICAGVEWNLSNAQIASITSVVFVGTLLGSVIWGLVADRYGRRGAYIAAAILISVPGLVSTLSPNLLFLLYCRFLVGFGVGGVIVPFDLVAEFLPRSHRGSWMMYIELFWTAGSVFVAGIAWLVLTRHGWRVLSLITAIPVICACVVSLLYLPESARWHLEQGRVKEAEDVVREASVVNGTILSSFSLSPSSTSRSVSACHSAETSDDKETVSAHSHPVSATHSVSQSVSKELSTCTASLFELFSPSMRWITIPLYITSLCYGFAYYGVILLVSRVFSFSSLSGCSFDYLSIFINSSSEVVGVIIVALMIDPLGRTRSQAVMYVASGVAVALMGTSMPHAALVMVSGIARLCVTGATAATCVAKPELFPTACGVAVALMGTSMPHAALVMVSGIARLCIMGASSATWVATPELFPTRMRATGHSMTNAMARVGGVIAPFLVQSQVSIMAVGLVLCLVNVIAGFTALSLPETKGCSLDEPQEGDVSCVEDPETLKSQTTPELHQTCENMSFSPAPPAVNDESMTVNYMHVRQLEDSKEGIKGNQISVEMTEKKSSF
eukprot:CAMPEP_0182437268 /NCGR_PEP_ID=MMETSP1167-20130531/84927_1 /TAXON_ID=2988 /ORGANISM="Mallomonas Sp, Strain CCMP3275" /LENGTH=603 /DNA_ID=CAMNT_0024630117 /DNA_START=187 /DNA_END=1997 /DNA_ORIENTATION=+